MRIQKSIPLLLLFSLALGLAGCDGCRRNVREKYYDSLTKVGIEKRELLVKRVDRVRDAQEDAQEEFEDALEQFQALVGHEGTELESMYGSLKAEFEDAEARAEEVRERIQKVENVAQALFDEWQEEIAQFENKKYRRDSEQKLRETKTRYSDLLRTMQRASKSMDPVLTKLQDQVLYLKHNLNAQALGNLGGEADRLSAEVGDLIADMQSSIQEAERFIEDMTADES